jgi:site-specific DNA recombinase
MDDLERQKAEITARIAVETPPLPDVSPNIAEIYRHKVQQLSAVLADPKTAEESTRPFDRCSARSRSRPAISAARFTATLRGVCTVTLQSFELVSRRRSQSFYRKSPW